MTISRPARIILFICGFSYILFTLLVPVMTLIYRTLSPGFHQLWLYATTPAALSACELTLTILVIMVPANIICGTGLAFAIVRWKIPGRRLLDNLINIPVGISPVVAGVALIVLWGKGGWLGWVSSWFFPIIFHFPAMVLATIFVTFPFVARELIPVLEELGEEQETAAATLGANAWQIFRYITFPGIRWGLVYGIIITIARGLGEFGAVTMVSSGYPGIGMTMTMLVSSRYTDEYNVYGAYVGASILMLLSMVFLVILNLIQRKKHILPGNVLPVSEGKAHVAI